MVRRLNDLAALRRARRLASGDGFAARAKPFLIKVAAATPATVVGLGSQCWRVTLGRSAGTPARLSRRYDGVAARADGFELAQWALQTAAGEALSLMSVRVAKDEAL